MGAALALHSRALARPALASLDRRTPSPQAPSSCRITHDSLARGGRLRRCAGVVRLQLVGERIGEAFVVGHHLGVDVARERVAHLLALRGGVAVAREAIDDARLHVVVEVDLVAEVEATRRPLDGACSPTAPPTCCGGGQIGYVSIESG